MSSTSKLAVTRYPPIRDQIATVLRNAIANLEFLPGQVLIERELCEQTGASRPSVREALRQLEAEGLVESRNGRGTMVRVPDRAEVTSLYEVRAVLEGLAAQLFCERATAAQRADLASAATALERATALGSAATADVLQAQAEFYRVLFAGSENALLEQMVQGLQVRLAQLRSATLRVEGRAAESQREFAEILAAIEQGEPAEARRAAERHVRMAARAMALAARDVLP